MLSLAKIPAALRDVYSICITTKRAHKDALVHIISKTHIHASKIEDFVYALKLLRSKCWSKNHSVLG